jgi:hypothetical protein
MVQISFVISYSIERGEGIVGMDKSAPIFEEDLLVKSN